MNSKHASQLCQTAQIVRRVFAAAILTVTWMSGRAVFDSAAQPVAIALAPKPSGLPGDWRMSWTGGPDSTYLIQTATNLTGPGNWDTFDAVTASNSGVVYDISPGPAADADPVRFYRLVLPQPQITSVQPTFINSSGSNAVLYILGQLLPTNATVVIDGQDFTPVVINSNGVWASVSLTNLPPGTSVTGQIQIIDNGSGLVVATLPVQSPIFYGTAPGNEQLQGPPDEPLRAAVGGYIRRKVPCRMKSGTITLTRGAIGPSTVVVAGDSNHDLVADDFVAVPDRSNSRLEIQMSTGEVQENDTDLAVTGRGMDFVWTRTYRSRTGPTTAQGVRWDFSYDINIAVQGDGTVALATGDGRTETFHPNGSNSWVRDEYFVQVGDLNGDGMPDVLFPDGGKWLFNPLGTAAAGKLASIVDRNSNTMTLTYDGSGRLTTVVDTLNRTNTVAYNSGGMIASVTDFSGRTASYSYDGNNDLTQCVSPAVTGTPNGNDFPGGKTNSYTYTSGFSDNRLNHNLAIVTHEMGHNWGMSYTTVTDPTSPDFAAVASVSYGPYVEQFTRFAQTPSPANGFATVEAIICDAMGNVSECYYDSHQRCVEELDYTGRSDPTQPVTQTSNRPTGKLRPSDPDTFETLWTWNPDSLCSSVIENPQTLPRQQVFIHERDLNGSATAQKKGDLRAVDDIPSSAVSTTGNGTVDTTERSWHFDYDSRFGSPGAYGDAAMASSFTRTVYIPVVPSMAAPGAHTGSMFGNHKDVMMAVCLDSHTRRFAPGGDGVAAASGGHVGNMVGNHKDCMMALAGVGSGGGETGPAETLLMPALMKAKEKANRVAAAPGGHTGNMIGNHKDCMMALGDSGGGNTGNLATLLMPALMKAKEKANQVAPAPGGHTGNLATLLMPALMKAKEKANQVKCGSRSSACDQDTDGNGGLDHLATAFGDGTGRINRVRAAFGDMNGDEFPDFCISATDPDGNSAAANYDQSGNALQWIMAVRVQRVEMDMAYNPHGQVIGITNMADANGYTAVDAFAYYGSGPQNGYLQSWTADAAGLALTTSYEYDARGSVTRVVDPRGNDYLFTYNAMDQLVQSQTPTNITARCTSQFYYDTNDNLIQATTELLDNHDNPQHQVTDTYTYDSLNRCDSVVLAGDANHNLAIGFAYDGNGNTTAVYSPMAMSGADTNSFISIQYDERDLLLREADAPLNAALALTNEWDYDVNGNCIQVTTSGSSGPPETLALAYDGFERCISETDAVGNVETAAYDRCDNPVIDRFYEPGGATGNELLAQFSCQYDQLYRPVTVQQARFDAAGNAIGAGFALTTIAYAPDGEVLSITDDNQHTTSYSYDTAGRCIQVTDARNDLLQFACDACGNVTNGLATDRPDGGTTTQQFSAGYAYDSQNRCVSRTDNSGNTCSWTYDSLDRLTQQTDANGNLTGWAYDDLGRCTETVADLDHDGVLDFALDAKNVFTWDDNSRCISVTDANTNTTLYAYDSLGRCLAISNADNTASQFTYDAFGNQITSIDPNGTSVTNHYDSLNRIVHRDIAARNVTVASTTFENFAYDGLSRLISASNDISGSTFAYDSLNDCTGTSQDGLVTSCSYDGVANLLSATYPSGRVVNYTYDALNEVASLSSAASGLAPATLAQYFYAGPGRLAKITRANLTATQITWDGVAAKGNSSGDFGWGEVASVNHTANAGKIAIDERQFAYDHSQNKISRLQTAPFTTGAPTLTNGFSYDAVNRLTAFTHLAGTTNDYSISYVMDDNRIRKLETINGVSAPYTLNSAIPPGDFEMNRYTVTPFGSQTYDPNGNMTGSSSTSASLRYGYDYANRLVSVDDLLAGGTVASFGYDALGRRVIKTTSTNVSTEFAVLRERFLTESYQGGTLTGSYAYGDLNGDGIPDIAASFVSGGGVTYYHSDDMGNVLALSDAQGNVLERVDYGDYGEPTFLASDGSILTGTTGKPLMSSSQGNPFQFQGMFWDGETGLYLRKEPGLRQEQEGFSGADYLDPQIGRCINNTPVFDETPWSACGIAFEQGDLHKPYVTFAGSESYTFCGGNPWSPATAKKKKSTGGIHVTKTQDMASP